MGSHVKYAIGSSEGVFVMFLEVSMKVESFILFLYRPALNLRF